MTDLLTENARLRAALQNVMGHVDTPIGRRRLIAGSSLPEWLTDARAALATPAPDAPKPFPTNCREWFYYPIEMPISADGQGPATVGVDAAKITYEVWDVLLNTHSSHDHLSDAINEAMRLNLLDEGKPAPDAVQEAASGRLLEKALKVAMGYLAHQQPDDSSAVDDWFLACAAVQAELDDTDGGIEQCLDAAIRAIAGDRT